MFTLSDIFDRYLIEEIPGKSPAYQKDQRAHIKRLCKVFGDARPDELTRQHVYQYLDARRKFPYAANHEIATLSHVFSKAIRWGILDNNPVKDIEYFPRKPRDRYVSDEEFWTVHRTMPPMFQVAMELAVLTGLRRGDLLALTRDNLTDDGIEVVTSKTDKALIIEWSDELRAVVQRALRHPPQVRRPIICTRKGTAYTGNGFATIWQLLMLKAVAGGVKRFQFRDLRAKSASDDTLDASSARLGHESTAITQRVYRRKPRRVRPLR